MLFNVWRGNIRVLMHLRILPDHQNQVLKKIILMYGLVINVFLRIFAYIQTTRIKFLKKIFLTSDVGKNMFLRIGNIRVLMHLHILRDNQNQVLKKDIF